MALIEIKAPVSGNLEADGFLVVAHGPAAEMERVHTLLQISGPLQIDLHADAKDPALVAA